MLISLVEDERDNTGPSSGFIFRRVYGYKIELEGQHPEGEQQKPFKYMSEAFQGNTSKGVTIKWPRKLVNQSTREIQPNK